jgi:Zn-dependent protease with chaperone function
MIGALGETQLFLLAASSFFFVAGVAVTAAVRIARARLASIEAVPRARLLTILGVAPAVLALSGVLACLAPSTLAHVTGDADHCGHHDDGHPHLCPWHAPHDAGSAIGWIVCGLAAGWVLARTTAEARRVARGVDVARALERVEVGEDGVALIESDAAFSAAVGLWHPVVVLSRGLRDQLAANEKNAVIAHENAHVERRDALRQVIVRAALCAFPRAWTETLESELSIACEEACDGRAAIIVDDPLVVADAIVKAARAARGAMPALVTAVSFGANATERRVRALCSPPVATTRLGVGALVLVVAVVFLLAHPLHHVTETVLGAIAH